MGNVDIYSASISSISNMAHKTAQFEKLVQRLMDEYNVPGLSIAIIQGEEISTKV